MFKLRNVGLFLTHPKKAGLEKKAPRGFLSFLLQNEFK